MSARKRGGISALRRLLTVAAIIVVVAVMGLWTEAPSIAQTPPSDAKCVSATSAANIPMTAAQGAAIIRELRAIRTLLENGAAPRPGFRRSPATAQNVRMKIDPGWHALGSAHAPVIMIEFTDLQCPFCRRFQTTTFAALKKEYIDTGKVRFIGLDMPLPMHAYAMGAAEAEQCAGDLGKFWQFRDAVLGDQAPPTPDVLDTHARELGLGLQRFQGCLSQGKYSRQIQNDQREAAAVGVRGTPAFVIGRSDGGWISGISMAGARPLRFFEREIDTVLNESHTRAANAPRPESANPASSASDVAKAANR